MLIDTVYGMAAPKQSRTMQNKLTAAKEYLGNKYLLAIPIKKLMVPLK